MRVLGYALLVFMACAMQSCKEGCKDKSAINYDSKAKEENGTCLYCTDTSVSETATYFFTSANAPNPSAWSIEFILVNTNAEVVGNGCKMKGLQTGNTCNNYLFIVNLTDKNVNGPFNAEFFQGFNELWFFSDQNGIVDIGPPGSGYDTVSLGLVDSVSCANPNTGRMQVNVNDFQFN
jgi:hypothetical protein